MEQAPETTGSAASHWDRAQLALGTLAALGAAILFAWRLRDAAFLYDLWSDRDLARAAHVALDAVPTHGAELSYGSGARIPGGLQYLMMAPMVAVVPDPTDVYRALVLLEAVGVAVLAYAVGRRAGVLAGGFTALAWTATDAVTDTLTRIWNPSLVPLFAVLAWVAASDVILERSGVALVVLFAALVAGGQMHLSMLLLAPPLFLAAMASRPRTAAAAVLSGVAVALLLQAPWLLAQLRGDVAVAGALADQAQVVRLTQGDPGGVPKALGAALGLRRLLPGRMPVVGLAAWAALVPTVVGLLATVVAAVRAAPATRRLARTALATIALFYAYYAWDDQIDIDVRGTARYLLPLLPLAAATAGVGAAAIGRVGRRSPHLATAAFTCLATVGLSTFDVARNHHRNVTSGSETFATLRSLLDELRAAHGGSLADVTARTVVLHRTPGGYRWEGRTAVDYLLALEGHDLVGSGGAPCLAVLNRRDDPAPVTPAELAAWIGPDVHEVRIEREQALAGERRLVVYTPDTWPCRTSFVDPYLATPTEDALLAVRGRLPTDDRAVPLPGPTGGRRFGFRLVPRADGPANSSEVVGAVDVVPEGQRTRFTLHALQLRGSRFNLGWFADAVWADPEIVVEEDGQETVVPLARGLVGLGGAPTPLTATTDAPVPSTATIRLRTRTLPVPPPSPLPEGTPREVVLVAPTTSARR